MSLNHLEADSELSGDEIQSPLVKEEQLLISNNSEPVIEDVEPMTTPRDDGTQIEPESLPIPVEMN